MKAKNKFHFKNFRIQKVWNIVKYSGEKVYPIDF